MRDKILISVIIPMYRVEVYLAECLDSVVNQTLREIEIILVDDGSPDRCGGIADEYAMTDSRIKVIHQENRGVGHARNTGLKIACGDFVYIMDSDDWLRTDALERMYAKASETGADIVMINYLHVYGTNERSMTKAETPPWLKFAGCGAWLRLIRRTLLTSHPELKFPENIWTGQDSVFSYMLDFFTDKLVWLDEYLLYRRHRPGSKQQTLSQKNDKVIQSVANALAFWDDFIESHPDLRQQSPEAFIIIFGNLLTYLKLPLFFKWKMVRKYQPRFRQLDRLATVDWRRTPRVWWFWKFGIYVPPTHLRSITARITGKKHRLNDLKNL
jgi:glycosyltransferase involved in cell wall biosynthesis